MTKQLIALSIILITLLEVHGQCNTFVDNINGEELMDTYVLYRDQMRNGNYELAYVEWKNIYDLAPAADGKRNSVFLDGQILLEFRFNKSILKVDKLKILEFYYRLRKEQLKCYPNSNIREVPKDLKYFKV